MQSTTVARWATLFAFVSLIGISLIGIATLPAYASLELRPIGQYATGIFDDSAAEIVAFDDATGRLFVVNASQGTVDVLDLSQPWNPTRLASLDVSDFGASANSVAVRGGIVAIAVESDNKQAPGAVIFTNVDGDVLSAVTVGALPDMVTFTPNGRQVLVANEGEPADYCDTGLAADPEGSISIIDVTGGFTNLTQANVSTATFTAFNAGAPDGVRIFGPGATVAQDLEPEYIAVSADSTTAYVTLQENNALAIVDIASATVTSLLPLGTKDHSQTVNAFDASNRDGAIRIVPWPTRGMYQPDAIESYQVGDTTYLVTANEGDARDYDCYSEEERVDDLDLDPTVFGNADALQDDAELGRLKTTSATGDANGDGLFEEIYSYGARSFTIWNAASGEIVYDSGHDLELITASIHPTLFNNDEGEFDGRSDDKGPEPEGLDLGFFRDRLYAFVGLERTGGVMVYDVTDPAKPFFVTYANNLNADGEPAIGETDIGPEGILFIPRGKSPINRALLVVSNEVSGTVTIYSVRPSRVED